jgi:hypothetical protein
VICGCGEDLARGGDPKTRGFARPGGRRSFDSWQVGVSIDSLLFNKYGRVILAT